MNDRSYIIKLDNLIEYDQEKIRKVMENGDVVVNIVNILTLSFRMNHF